MRSLRSLLVAVSLLAAACTSGAAEPTAPTRPDPTSTTTATHLDQPPHRGTTTAPRSRPLFCDVRWEPEQMGLVESTELNEISGAVVSLRHDGVMWLHNDSGSDPAVYATHISGTDLGRVSLPDLSARDWEDIALGPGPDPRPRLSLSGRHRRQQRTAGRRPDPPHPGAGAGHRSRLRRRDARRDVSARPDGSRDAPRRPASMATWSSPARPSRASRRSTAWPGISTGRSPTRPSTSGEIGLGTFALATGGDAGTDRIVIRTYDEVFTWERRPGSTR